MLVFIVLAAALTAICMGAITVPLLKPVPSRTAPARLTALAAAAVLAGGSAALYLTWSTWSWRQSPGVQSPEGMVERLVHELNDHPDNLAGWLMLGRSYTQLQEYPLAVRSYERANRVAGGRNVEALMGEADAMTLMDNSALDGQAGRLIERALQIDPSSPKALFFGAAAALRRGELPLARARFTKLLSLDPPAKVKAILEQEISAIDRKLTGPPASAAKKP